MKKKIMGLFLTVISVYLGLMIGTSRLGENKYVLLFARICSFGTGGN
jgi:hypothetical protein